MFYAAATIAMVVLCYGPVMRVGEAVILDPVPYRWLMHLPGLRSAARADAILDGRGRCAWRSRRGSRSRGSAPAGGHAALRRSPSCFAGLMLDGWIDPVNMAAAPETVAPGRAPRSGAADPRAAARSRVGCGGDVSLDLAPPAGRQRRQRLRPAALAPLMDALDSHDPAMLVALGSLGTFDVSSTAPRIATAPWRALRDERAGVEGNRDRRHADGVSGAGDAVAGGDRRAGRCRSPASGPTRRMRR